MKSQYVDRLLQEYAYYGIKKETMRLNNEEVIIPAEYVMTGGDFQKAFLKDYFDLQKKDLERYKTEKLKPQIVEMNGVSYIVPFKWRDKNYKDTKVVEYVLKKAKAKYNQAIALTSKMDQAYPKRKYTVEVAAKQVEALKKAYNKYLFDKCVDKSKYAMLKASDMILSEVRLMRGNNSVFRLDKLQSNMKDLASRSLIVAGVMAGSSGFLLAQQNSNSNDSQNKDKLEIKDSINQMGTVSETTIRFEEAQKRIRQKSQDGNLKNDSILQGKSSEEDKSNLFNKFMEDIFQSEGGYGDERTIDQPTNMGIIQPTLNTFMENYPDLAKKNKFQKNLKKLTREQATLIYRKLYFDKYQIGDYKNESIGLLIFDLYVNHEPATVKGFVDQALMAAHKEGVKTTLPNSTPERVKCINSLAGNQKAEHAFYKTLLDVRRKHMLKVTNNGTSRLAQGLQNRVNKFAKRFVSTYVQDQNTALAMNFNKLKNFNKSKEV